MSVTKAETFQISLMTCSLAGRWGCIVQKRHQHPFCAPWEFQFLRNLLCLLFALLKMHHWEITAGSDTNPGKVRATTTPIAGVTQAKASGFRAARCPAGGAGGQAGSWPSTTAFPGAAASAAAQRPPGRPGDQRSRTGTRMLLFSEGSKAFEPRAWQRSVRFGKCRTQTARVSGAQRRSGTGRDGTGSARRNEGSADCGRSRPGSRLLLTICSQPLVGTLVVFTT